MDLKARFFDYLRYELERKPSTIEIYEDRIRVMERHLGKRVEEMSADDLRKLKRTRPSEWSGSYLKDLFSVVKTFNAWATLEGIANDPAIPLVKAPRVQETDIRPLGMAEALTILAACSKPLEYRVAYLGLYAGLRIGESASVHGSMWEADVLRVRGEKTDRPRAIPIHPELEAVKWEVLGRSPTNTSTLQRVKRRLEEKTGIAFVAHQLRKTFATTLYDAGVPDRIVKDLLGHTQDVTGIYVEISPARKREAINRLHYVAAEPIPVPTPPSGDARLEQALGCVKEEVRWLVAEEIREVQQPRAVRAVARRDRTQLVLDVDGGQWHQQDPQAHFGIHSACGSSFNPVCDETAAVLLALAPGPPSLCACLKERTDGFTIPSRVQPMVSHIDKALGVART